MWIDLAGTIYKQGKCDSIVYDYRSYSDAQIKQMMYYWIFYKVLNAAPTIFVASYISINLTYQSLIKFFDSMILSQGMSHKTKLKKIWNINDEFDVFYCHSDILYVLDLFQNSSNLESKNNSSELGKNIKAFNKIFNNTSSSNYIRSENSKVELKKSFFRKFIYDWNDNFKFTSRFVNTHIVAFLALFHFSMFILYYLIFLVLLIQKNTSFIDFNNLADLTVADIICALGTDFCIADLTWPLPIPKALTEFGAAFIPSINALFITPFFGALLICTIQVFLGIRDTKKHLIQIYKGKCVYLRPINSLTNASIAGSSFHYGGYLTGYLIW